MYNWHIVFVLNAKIFRDYLADCCEVKCDVMGNTIAALNTSAPVRVMLSGHYVVWRQRRKEAKAAKANVGK